jgi:hypothetical protein
MKTLRSTRNDEEPFYHVRNGFGTRISLKSKFDSNTRSSEGKWINDEYIETGFWQKGQFQFPCNSPQDCTKVAAQKEAQARREQAEREESARTACKKYYAGYVGYVDFKGTGKDLWGSYDANYYGQFIVMGTGNGNVSMKGTDGGSYPGYNKMVQLTCVRLKEVER